MTIFSAREARTRFGELLDRVTRGEEIVITRHDKPVSTISEMAEKYALSIYDAVYLELALRKTAPLASRDARSTKPPKAPAFAHYFSFR